MLVLVLLLSTFQLVHSSCPSGWDLVRNGECRGKVANVQSFFNDEALEANVAKCDTRQGTPPIIHDDEDAQYWAANEFWPIILGLTCNTATKRWEWVDGSAVDYKPPKSSYDKELDGACVTGCVWYESNYKEWNHKCGHTETSYDAWCVSSSKPTDNECDNFGDDNDDGVCYQIGTAVENFQQAQIFCRNFGADLASIHNQKENDFIRRLAITSGAVNGVFIGGAQLDKNDIEKGDFEWVDGTPWDYENFYPGFPNPSLGHCLSMDTIGTAGLWMNINCTTKLAVSCERQPNTSFADTCTQGPWKEGQIIHYPGYPFNASLPCDYFLSVDKGKRVEVTVQLLEANSCCDHLLLTDNYLGGNVVANLTGQISNKTYTTKSSNFMRVSWLPNGGVNVRGMMISFRGVF